MRFILTVVLAALLIVITYLVASWFVDGYFGGNIFPDGAEPATWSAPDSWSEWHDIVTVAAGAVLALAALLACVLLVALTAVVLAVRRTLRENVAPTLDATRELVDEVRGTAEFVGESAVSPIIRVYSIVSGVRQGMGALGAAGKRFRSGR